MSDLIIETKDGKLKGVKRTSILGHTYNAFLGIPYAKPPIGKLRFKDPKPVEPWNDLRDASTEGGMCASRHMVSRDFEGGDDCLYLNVYSPNMKGTLKPVMVWIHGGGFMLGCGDSDIYGPDFFIQHDVILITMNYRLGALGFLHIPECGIGNAGLKDQVLALKWIQKNIEYFGGDPKNVTLFGSSAGASSVNYHMMSPMSKGLFHKAIMQSGTAMNFWASSKETHKKSIVLGKLLGFDKDDPQELLEFLQSVPPLKLAEIQYETISAQDKVSVAMLFPFVPTIEAKEENAFISDDPETLMKRGNIMNIPCLSGTVSCEGALTLRVPEHSEEHMINIDRNFSEYLPHWMGLDKSKYSKHPIDALKVRQFFFREDKISRKTLNNYAQMQSDLVISYKVDLMNRLIISKIDAPCFIYLLDFDGNRSVFKKFFGASGLPGTSHGDDVCYMFTMKRMGLQYAQESPEADMIWKITKMWTNFAKSSDPVSHDVSFKWHPANRKTFGYLHLGKEVNFQEGRPFQERMDMWDNIYNHP